ncbi:hypothetical protein F383_32619 [Gossypium arboreum]|uniref:Uncharacterized protein n=1 Tax=Gossypium arboreum TaxID=29729 RepID=A0A0B0PKH2_GOSAR|nr:hypothetical protein F383_32619 [Gossypium arboreum]
MSEVRGRAYLK